MTKHNKLNFVYSKLLLSIIKQLNSNGLLKNQAYFFGSSQKWVPYKVDTAECFLTGEILFEYGSCRTSLFRRRTFWLLFGPSKSNKEKISFC